MEERRDAIVELVNARGTVSFRQLKEAFPNVSEMTLRTDLKALDSEGRIVRIHGGARSVEQIIGTDGMLSTRTAKNIDAKNLIARKALSLIQPNTTVFLDSGSTTTAFAGALPDKDMLIFTSGLTCAAELAHLERPTTYLVGGKFNRYSMSVNGSSSVDAIKGLAFDQYFMGVTGYSPKTGFACGSSEEASLKRACIEHADEVIALMDSSKVDVRSTFSVCGLDRVDIIVSDGNLPDEFLQACATNGVEVL